MHACMCKRIHTHVSVVVRKLDQDSVSLAEEKHAVAFVKGDNK